MNKLHLYILAGLLTLVAIGTIAYKILVLQFPLQPVAEVDAWDVEVRVSFQGQQAPAKVSLYIPRDDRLFAAADEQFISRGYGVNTRKDEGNRRVVWSIRRAKGEQFLFYRATIRPIASTRETTVKRPEMKPPEAVDETQRLAIDAVLTDVRAHSGAGSAWPALADICTGRCVYTLAGGMVRGCMAWLRSGDGGTDGGPESGVLVAWQQ